MDARKVMTISWFYTKTFLRGLVRIHAAGQRDRYYKKYKSRLARGVK